MADWDVVGTSTLNPQPTDADPWAVVGETHPITGAARIPAMIASNAAKGLASLAAIPGDISNKLDEGANAVRKWIDPSAEAISTDNPLRLTGDKIDQAGEKLGLLDRRDLEPQTTAEKYLAAASQGAGAAIPAAATGGGTAIPALLTGAASGAGAQAGRDMAPDHPILGPALGAVAGGLTASGALGAGAKAINAVKGVGNEMTDAYKTAGITPRLAGDITQKPFLQAAQAFAAKSPLGAGRIHDAAEATAHEFGNAAENVAAPLGGSKTAQDVGTALQGETAKWMTNFKAKNAANWNALDSYFPNGVKVSNYENALDSISKDLPKAPATAKVLQPGLTKNLADALKSDLGNGDELPWQTVKGIRSRIGEMLEDPNLPADTGTVELKRLYAGLTSDMKAAAKAASPQAQAAFDAANTYTKNGHTFIDMIVRPAIKQGQTPEGAAATILPKLDKGGSAISQIRAEMPDAADEIAAFKVRDMAAATAGRQNAAGDAVSPSSFLTDWNKLSPEAKKALFTDPRSRAKLSALAKAGEGIKQTLAKLNTSNTAAHGAMGELINSPARIMAGYFGGQHLAGEAGGLIGAALGASAPLGGNIAARLTSSPALTSYFAAPGFASPRALRLATGLGSYAALVPPNSAANLGQ